MLFRKTMTAHSGPSSPLTSSFGFAFDRVKSLAATHPEWKQEQQFKAVLEGDPKTLLVGGEPAIRKLLAVSPEQVVGSMGKLKLEYRAGKLYCYVFRRLILLTIKKENQ
jgi:hypothetical protein